MSADDLTKTVLSLLTLNGSVIQLWTTIQGRLKWGARARAEVGDLGWLYAFIVTVPLNVLRFLLMVTLLASLLSSIAGLIILKEGEPPPIMRVLFENSILIAFFYGGFLLVIVHINIISQICLGAVKRIRDYRFRPGWINADWHLNSYKEFLAINTDAENIERLANSIFKKIRAQEPLQNPERAITPTGLTHDEVANYILFGCAIESRIGQIYPNDQRAVKDSWDYLAWASMSPQRPFRPEQLMRFAAPANSFYGHLRSLATQSGLPQGGSPGALLDEVAIDQTVNTIVKQLVKDYRGHGTRLATGQILKRQSSPQLLLNNLLRFERFKSDDPDGETFRRLYLKLSVRMEVWPVMRPGPFLYPFNSGIALLFLRSNCLLIPADTKAIDISDNFRALLAWAEDRAVEFCHRLIQLSAGDAETASFCRAVFDCGPLEVSRWKLSDYIDVWLYTQTLHHCSKRTKDNTGAVTKCSLLVGGQSTPCFCDAAVSQWHLDGNALKRD